MIALKFTRLPHRAPIFTALVVSLVGCVILTGCGKKRTLTQRYATLTEARQHFKTKIVPSRASKEPVEQAPPSLFKTVAYPAQAGQLAAYLTPDPGDGKKHPAIVWITGGDCNSIGDVWTPAESPDNDQTAAQYRKAGIVMLFPSLRGGNTNPGTKEGFLGEVDDVLAARAYLAKQSYVDEKRIYLGGHSTGGTLAMLTAECAPASTFRAVFAFGPVASPRNYGKSGQASGFTPFDLSDDDEVAIRSPYRWMSSLQTPTWVIEGDGSTGSSNIKSLEAMRDMNQTVGSQNVHFVKITHANHFSVLAEGNTKLADKIAKDAQTIPATQSFTISEISRPKR